MNHSRLHRSTIRSRSGFTLVELLVSIGIIGILIGMLLPAVQAVRESSRKTQCQNNLRQVGLALTGYHSSYQHLPAGSIHPPGHIDDGRGHPRATWSIAILPNLEMGSLYSRYDPGQPSTAIANHEFAETSVSTYQCPSETASDVHFEPKNNVKFSRGNYAANYGSGSWGRNFWDDVKYRGVMGQNSRLKFSSIVDGTSNTVAVAEIRSASDFGDNRGAWAFAAPGSSTVGLDCDTECRGINDDPSSDWIPYCPATPGGMKCNFQNNRFSNAGPRSQHPGGAMLLFCDGAVRFVSEQVSIEVLADQFTSMSGESN